MTDSIDFHDQVAVTETVGEPNADDIAAHLSEVSSTEPFTVPESIFEEVFGVCAQRGVGVGV
jgi:hypothetical protein